MITSILISHLEPPEFKALDFGVLSVVAQINADYVVGCKDGNTLAIERKTPNDLLGSIHDGRLFTQCHKMREISQFCYIIVTGELLRTHNNKVNTGGMKDTHWNWDSVQGALLTVQEMGVNIVYCADFRDAVFRLAERNRDVLTIHPVRVGEPMSKAEAFLCSLPAIGSTRAMELLATFGTVANVLDWLTNVWNDYEMEIKGIKHNQKCAIRDILGLQGYNYLTQHTWRDDDDES